MCDKCNNNTFGLTGIGHDRRNFLKTGAALAAAPLLARHHAPCSDDASGAYRRARRQERHLGGKGHCGYQLFVPIIDKFLKEHLFADIFGRDTLDYQSRELATISALASMTGTASQLRFHFGAAMNTGLTEPQMKEFSSVLEAKVGKKEAESASQVLTVVLQSKK